ncbi:MAG: hypothetical protein Q7V19_11490, partial [Bacteroidales bacterium]|nr:hypothetical protein [Bacteroidales bacterium]
MKKLFIIVMVLLPSFLMSQNLNIATLHKSNGVQNFTGMLAFVQAYSASASGDTIYLSGGSFSAPDTINKSLTIIGAGHYPDSTIATGKTIVSTAVVLNDLADNTYIEGIHFLSNFQTAYDVSVNNLTLRRCRIDGHFKFNGNYYSPVAFCLNPSIIECVFAGGNELVFGNSRSMIISKSIFHMSWRTLVWVHTATISNCIFFSTNGTYFLDNAQNTLFKNNIVKTSAGYPFNGTNNYFANNVFLGFTVDNFYGNTAVNNYHNVTYESFFVNQNGNDFNYNFNYHLNNTTTYTGEDGTQVGIYGTNAPYKEGAVPGNPHVRSKNIAVSTNAN